MKPFLSLLLLFSIGVPLSYGEDQLILRSGTTVKGTITGASGGASGGSVMIATVTASGGSATQTFYFADLASVTMSPPGDFAQAQSGDPASRIKLLTPLVQAYQGLPADWVIDAMALLADAYDAQNQADKSLEIYNQINQFYPNSRYQIAAQTGKAKLALQAGKTADALTALKPLLDQANANLAPSPSEGRLYAQAFYLQGQALEGEKKLPAALEAYLTVKTMFYQNPALASQAETAAARLRNQNPGLGVN